MLEEALEANPFWEGYDISRIFFITLADTPPDLTVRERVSRDLTPEKFAFGKDTTSLYIPGSYGRGALSSNFLKKRTGPGGPRGTSVP